MSGDLEKSLRQALRPVDPGEEFTRKVMERAGRGPRRTPWISAVIAASVVLLFIAGVSRWHQQQQAAGLAARAQVLEALRVTSNKLDLAYRLVNAPPASPPARRPEPTRNDDSGA